MKISPCWFEAKVVVPQFYVLYIPETLCSGDYNPIFRATLKNSMMRVGIVQNVRLTVQITLDI